MKYIIFCRNCGRTLMKTPEPTIRVLEIEIKCPECKAVVHFPDGVDMITDGKKPAAGLEKA